MTTVGATGDGEPRDDAWRATSGAGAGLPQSTTSTGSSLGDVGSLTTVNSLANGGLLTSGSPPVTSAGSPRVAWVR